MNKKFFISCVFNLLFFITSNPLFSQHHFYINLYEREDDLFHVTLYPEKLTNENKIYNFAATAPGTYQLMNIGRFVRSFHVFDNNGNEIGAEKISENKWSISQPEKVKKIVYSIAETWDTPVDEDYIYLMAGTSIENDHVLINSHCVFGYFEGMQDYPINIKFDYPKDWKIGTALDKNSGGYYYTAENYDHLVDSPILLGRLSEAALNVSGTDIEVYTYSKTDLIKSEDLLNAVKDIIFSAEKFLVKLPVNKYTFLFHFEDQGVGAWEHSYSSEYIYQEAPLSKNYIKIIRSTVAHEFFHIVTPLNIHSELITNFSFSEPKMSQHIWLYEGVTEWASDIMQLRSNIYSLEEYLSEVSDKLNQSDDFRKDISLTELAINSFELQDQFYIFYCKAAVIMTLLDIKILEESAGQKGLREVINELAEVYGSQKPFSEENFFNEFINRTYPSISEFINKYIKGTEPLPLIEYFNKVGVDYLQYAGYDSTQIDFEFGFGFHEGKLIVASVDNDNLPIKAGDIFYKYNGEEILPQNIGAVYGEIRRKKPGSEIKIIMKRGNEEFEFNYVLQPLKLNHVLRIKENLTEKQLKLNKAWQKNL